MAHFAKINQENIVVKVIVAEPEFFDTFVDDSPGKWLQTSYNTFGGIHYDQETNKPSEDQSQALRYNYAGLGFNYNPTDDAFYAPQPYDNWTLNTDTYLWEAPTSYPDDGNFYSWNEETEQWDVIE
jgi:hypothetical protein